MVMLMAVIMVVQLHQQNNTRAKMVTQTLKQSFFQHIFTAIKVLSGGAGLRHIELWNIFIDITKSPLFFSSSCFCLHASYERRPHIYIHIYIIYIYTQCEDIYNSN